MGRTERRRAQSFEAQSSPCPPGFLVPARTLEGGGSVSGYPKDMSEPRFLAGLGSGGHAASVSDSGGSAGYTVIGFIHFGAEYGGLEQPDLILEDLDPGAIDLGLGMGTNFLRE